MSEEQEVQVGKIYRLKEEIDTKIVFITDRFYYKNGGFPSERISGWYFKCYYLEKPNEILEGSEKRFLSRYELIHESKT
jgi:hypothetical protein